jgi:hypothetical protein
MKIFLQIALMTLPLCSVLVRAELRRKPVKLEELSPAVRKTVLQQKKNATIRRLEKTVDEGKVLYEVTLEHPPTGTAKTVFIDTAGTVVEVKQPVTLAVVSPPARKVIQSSVGDGTIVTLQSVQTASGILAAYELTFKRNGKQSMLRIGPDGTLVQE